MTASFRKIIELREIINRQFGRPDLQSNKGHFCTGLAALDEAEIPQGSLTEIVSGSPRAQGSNLLLYALLHAQKGRRLILIDGRDSFSPKGLLPSDLQHLLWLRCPSAAEAMKAADLIVRDGNVPLAVMLLTLNPAAELRRISPNAWHRLQMLAEKSGVTLLAFTPQAQIGCARLRLSVGGAFPLEKLHRCRAELVPSLQVQVERRRAGGRTDDDLRRAACA